MMRLLLTKQLPAKTSNKIKKSVEKSCIGYSITYAQQVSAIASYVLASTHAIYLHCDITAHTVLLYVLFCLTYMYCTLYVLYIPHTVHTVHVPCFPVSLFPMLRFHLQHLFTLLFTQLYKFTCAFTYHLCSHRTSS